MSAWDTPTVQNRLPEDHIDNILVQLKQKEIEKKRIEQDIKALKDELRESVNEQPGEYQTARGFFKLTERKVNDLELARQNLPKDLFDEVTVVTEKIDTNLVKAHIKNPDMLDSIKRVDSITLTTGLH